MAPEDADVVKFASAGDITARLTGNDWGDLHSGAKLARSFVDGPFSQVAGRHRSTAIAAMAIELAVEDYLQSLRPMPAQPMALIARALHLSRGRIADLIADDSSGADKIKQALARIEDQAAQGDGRGTRGPSGGADETDDATAVWPAST
jgi:hypothetical protein